MGRLPALKSPPQPRVRLHLLDAMAPPLLVKLDEHRDLAVRHARLDRLGQEIDRAGLVVDRRGRDRRVSRRDLRERPPEFGCYDLEGHLWNFGVCDSRA